MPITRSGKIQTYGYVITPNLPAGLNFNKNTGVITGQPLEPSPATDYTVIAENQFGTSSFNLQIEVQATTLGVESFNQNSVQVYPNPATELIH